jgi:hypothetical protein
MSQEQERIDELKPEIERLEADPNLDSEEYKQLKAMKEEVKQLEEKIEAELASRGLSVRPLQRRDIQVLQTLVKDYPGFKSLSEGDQLDRIVLVLTNVCGFGGVMASTIESALGMIPYKLSMNIEEHFKNSMWTNREGETRRRYVNNFAQAYKLEPGLTIKLISESKSADSEEPIRKTVSGKKHAVAQDRPSSPEELSKQGVVRAPTPIRTSSPTASPSASASAKVNVSQNNSGAENKTPPTSGEEDKKGIKGKLFSFFKK